MSKRPDTPDSAAPATPAVRKYSVVYRPFDLRRGREFTRTADEQYGVETVVMLLLTSGARITEIRCEGRQVSARDFDRLLQAAAARVASDMIRASLGLDDGQVRARFRFAH